MGRCQSSLLTKLWYPYGESETTYVDKDFEDIKDLFANPANHPRLDQGLLVSGS